MTELILLALNVLAFCCLCLVAIAIGITAFVVFKSFATYWKQRRCPHTGGIGETQACDAICDDCGKNLGFIGIIRAQRAAQQPSWETSQPAQVDCIKDL